MLETKYQSTKSALTLTKTKFSSSEKDAYSQSQQFLKTELFIHNIFLNRNKLKIDKTKI